MIGTSKKQCFQTRYYIWQKKTHWAVVVLTMAFGALAILVQIMGVLILLKQGYIGGLFFVFSLLISGIGGFCASDMGLVYNAKVPVEKEELRK